VGEAEALSDLAVMINKGRLIDFGSLGELLGKVKYRYKVVLADIRGVEVEPVETDMKRTLYVRRDSGLLQGLELLASRGLSFSLKPTFLENLFIMSVKSYEGR